MLNLFLSVIYILAPNHDFHTSWMNLTYDENKKEFHTSWRTDTEHLEGALTAFSGNEIHLENTSTNKYKSLINNYISKNTDLKFNGRKQQLKVEYIEVTFAETIVHFSAIKCRRKLRNASMRCTILQVLFPNQKNMVQLNYKGQMYSMLLGGSKLYEAIEIK